MQRKPSHLGSYSTPPGNTDGSGTDGTDLASIGFTGGITGRCMGAVSLRVAGLAQRCRTR